MLLSLVDEAQLPFSSRLVALSANSPTPPYANAEEFSRAVAYFERPGRPAAIRDLYRRGHALPAEAVTPRAVRTAPSEQAKQTPPRSRRRAVVVIAATALAVIAAGVALWKLPALASHTVFCRRAGFSAVSRADSRQDRWLPASGCRDRVVGSNATGEPARRRAGFDAVCNTRGAGNAAQKVAGTRWFRWAGGSTFD
jgi:hypothetical protein